LGVLDIATGSAPDSLAIWRIALHVQRFESVYNERVLVDATWRLTPVNQPAKKATICRGEAQVPVGEGVSAMVAGHQEAVHRIAQAIAAQLSSSPGKVAIDGMLDKGCTF